ncbi:MAG TPA: alpha/beta hydrolase-fold protein [Longimicrobiales bacterium]
MRKLARLTLLAVFPLGCFGAPAAAQAPIDFRPLDPQRGMVDCVDADTMAVAPAVCRVRRAFPLAELRARLGADDVAWRDGEELSWVAEIDADSVELSGGVQVPMARVTGTNVWVVTARVRELDRAAISWFFFPFRDGVPLVTRVHARHFRGPLAPAAADTVGVLSGTFVTHTIESRFLPAPRGVSAYIPPERVDEPIAGVVYIGDGAARPMAQVIDALIVAGKLPRLMIVGMETDTSRAVDADGADGRTLEYLLAPWDSTRFLAHERFFLEEVMPWAESLGAPTERDRRAVAGFSNSAAFAIDMGLRHPDRFGRVLAFSPAGRRAQILPGTALDEPAEFYLLGGVLERAFHAKALAWADIFRSRGIRYALREPVAGHDFHMWQAMFRDAVAWAFGG